MQCSPRTYLMDVLYRKRDKRVAEHSKKLQEKAEELQEQVAEWHDM